MSYLDRNKPLSLQYQLYQKLKKWFVEEFMVNEVLPTEMSIAEKYSISRGTVRIALDMLVKEGIITRYPGKGSFLNEDFFIRLKEYKIGIVLSDIDFFQNSIWEYSWSNYIEIINGIISNGHENNITVTLLSEKQVSESDNTLFNGFIVWPFVRPEVIHKLKKPYVLMIYDVDMLYGFSQLAEDIAENGYQNIGFIGFTSGDRIEAVNSVLFDRQNPEIQKRNIVECGGSSAEAYRSCMKLLQQNSDIDCIVCSTDIRSVGVISYLHELKVSIPEKIAVYGFDGKERDSSITDPYTTWVFDWKYPGEFSVLSIRAKLDGRKGPEYAPPKGKFVKRNG